MVSGIRSQDLGAALLPVLVTPVIGGACIFRFGASGRGGAAPPPFEVKI